MSAKDYNKPDDGVFENPLPLPDHLGWEEMEEGIFERVAIIESDRKKRRRWWMLFLAMLFLVGGSIFLLRVSIFNTATALNAPALAQEQVKHQAKKSGQATLTQNEVQEAARTNKVADNQRGLTYALELGRPTQSPKEVQGQQSIIPSSALNQRMTTEKENQPDARGEAKGLPLVVSENHTLFTSPNPQALPTADIPTLPILPLGEQKVIPEIKAYSAAPVFVAKPSNQRILLTGGVNFQRPNYSGDTDAFLALRQQTETGDWGYQVALGYERQLRAKSFLGTGLTYREAYTRLDARATETIERLQTNVLVRYSLNPVTSDTTDQVYVDTTIMVVQEKAIRHYNRHRTIEIPVYFGLNFGRGKWQVGIQAGISGVLHRRVKGQVLNRQLAISPIQSLTEDSFTNNITFAALGGGTISYQLQKNIGLLFRTNIRHFLNNNLESGPGFSLRPTLVQSSFGLSHSF